LSVKPSRQMCTSLRTSHLVILIQRSLNVAYLKMMEIDETSTIDLVKCANQDEHYSYSILHKDPLKKGKVNNTP
jgi:hypothetical protein